MIRRWLERVLLHLIQHDPEPVIDASPPALPLNDVHSRKAVPPFFADWSTSTGTSKAIENDAAAWTARHGRIWTTPMGSWSFDEVIRAVAGAETWEGE